MPPYLYWIQLNYYMISTCFIVAIALQTPTVFGAVDVAATETSRRGLPSGYMTFPIEIDGNGFCHLNARVQDIPVRFIIDTAAASSCMSKNVINKIKRKKPANKTTVTGPAIKEAAATKYTVPDVFLSRNFKIHHRDYISIDFDKIENWKADDPHVDIGLFGSDLLTLYQARIDYKHCRIHLHSPRQVDGLKWVGEWQAIDYVRYGEKITDLERLKKYKFVYSDFEINLSHDSITHIQGKVDFDLPLNYNVFAFTSLTVPKHEDYNDKSVPPPGAYKMFGIYRFDCDDLVICLPSSTAVHPPIDMISTAENKCYTFTFRRIKPAEKP